MSEADLKLAQEGYDAWNRDDLDWLLAHVTEDIEVRPMRGGPGEAFEEIYQGIAGWREFWAAWHQVWGSGATIKVHRFEHLGDHGVLALLSFDRPDGDGGEESVMVSHWLTFRDGKFATVTAMAPETAERRRETRR
jgi:ketosteroid isomerase-like protein